ncbi:thiamine transporter 1-like isoform X2 [Thrips palmi]|uniref:Thiamine transporter 1-like isoform X2 n=1 Tax=Thrips palmi TaxID=161013 RepID=A0A6P8ZTE0_THRPL|nr:thiamine transporter 1-like isoform X2 [Thrips palmi]
MGGGRAAKVRSVCVLSMSDPNNVSTAMPQDPSLLRDISSNQEEQRIMTVSWSVLVPLCSFGFLKEFRPSESFVTQYLIGPEKNFTKAQVNQDIYPVGTYSNLSLLVLVFLLTDWARYKPVIILEGLAGVVTYSLIIWGKDVPTIQVAEFFYGLFMATEVAYLTYIYAKCDKKDFQKVSGSVRSGILLGRFASGVTSQLTISLHFLTYHQLNYLTLAGVSLSVIVAAFLPSASRSIYFHRESSLQPEYNGACEDSGMSPPNNDQSLNCFMDLPLEGQESQAVQESSILSPKKPCRRILSDALQAMIDDFLSAYGNAHILKWSLWWASATCGYLQVTSYIQMLWQVTATQDQQLYNGVVDAAYTLIGAIATWFVGQHKMNLTRYSCPILTVCCLLQGTVLLISAGMVHLWVQYVLYIIFKILYHSTMVLASSEVAVSLKADSHALIFGFNMFIALCLQSIFTLAVAAKGGLELEIRSQFFVYGSYFVVLSVGFMLSIAIPAACNFFNCGTFAHKENKQPGIA